MKLRKTLMKYLKTALSCYLCFEYLIALRKYIPRQITMIQRVEIAQKRASKIGFDTHVRITDISHGIIGKTNLEEYIILNVHI